MKDEQLDLVWGLGAIGKLIGRSLRQTHYMASTGKIPARQIGGRWVAERSQLLNFFRGEAAR
nr:DNA-binding protein [Ancylobacter oerskovii]